MKGARHKDHICTIHLHEMPRMGKSVEIESVQGFPRDEDGVGSEVIGYRISFWGDENTLALDIDDGCTTL